MKTDKTAKAAKGTSSGRRKKRSPTEIKERLLQATMEEFRKNGFSATTAAIADRADVTEGQLYRYFDSKTDLFREAVFKPLNKELSDFCVRYLSAIVAVTDRKERIRIYVRQLQDFVGQHSELMTALTAFRPADRENNIEVNELDSLSLYFDTGTIMLETRQHKNPLIKPRLMAKIIFSSVLSTVIFKDWLFSDGSESDDEVIDAIGEFLIGGIFASTTAADQAH